MIDPIMPVAASIQAPLAVQSPIYRMHRAAIPSVREVMKIAGGDSVLQAVFANYGR